MLTDLPGVPEIRRALRKIAISDVVAAVEESIAPFQIRLHETRGGLITLLFHTIFLDEAELARDAAHPHQRTTLGQLEEIVSYFLQSGYRIIAPQELLGGIDPKGRYAMLTFDDGYFNNARMLPLLEKYNAHAVVFVSANHVKQQRPFWWEAWYAHQRARGGSMEDAFVEMGNWNQGRTHEVEKEIAEVMAGFDRNNDLSRPFNEGELREFARSKHITIGNHTADHDILTACSPEEAYRTIWEAQGILEEMIGYRPLTIAYPNGACSPAIIEIARRAGLKLGFGTVERKEYLPKVLEPDRCMDIGRFRVGSARSLSKQMTAFRSDLRLGYKWQRLKRMLRGNSAPGY